MKIKEKELKELLRMNAPPRGEGKKSKKFFKKNGFYHEDCWSLDITMAWFILPRLICFKKNVLSYPHECTNLKEWQGILDKMIEAFYLILKNPYLWNAAQLKKIEEGLSLFSHFYLNLWD